MNKKHKLVIFGTGEIGELAKYYFEHDSEYECVAFCCDDEFYEKKELKGLPIIPLSKLQEQYPSSDFQVHVALSYNRLNLTRKEKYTLLKEMGYKLASYICSKSVYWDDLEHGDNCFILENQTIQPTVKIGNNVMIWSGNHLGHGCKILDHTYISSHVCISGHVTIGERCFLGVNCAFKDFVNVGEAVFVTMGANVTTDIKKDSVVLAAQDSVLDIDHKLTQKIRKKYFNL